MLAIETATEACSVALFEDGRLREHRHETIGRGHAERLIPMIAELPDKGRAEDILVSLGPGSFTGTRIGLAAARALGIAWDAGVRGYPTLALVAAGAHAELGAAVPVDIAMTGGHGEYYVQHFDARGLPDGEARSLPPEQAAAQCSADIVAGSRARAIVDLRGFGRSLDLLPRATHAHLLPEGVLTAALSPLYGRDPDARLPG